MTLKDKRILLIIAGGIAAYKSLDLIRRLRERGAVVIPVMTKAAEEFVTELAVGALAARKVHTDLFSREDEVDVGHIRLALASTILLATERPVLMAPAMNPKMWSNPAVSRNASQLLIDGVNFIGPMRGEMAEGGEAGIGRMAEPLEIAAEVKKLLDTAPKLLSGKRAIVTSGPTHEPIDPVRYIANRSSGTQGHAIAAALAKAGADVTLVSGPVTLADPAGVKVIRVERAEEMRDAVLAALPADIAVMVAAVADWRVSTASGEKIKKSADGSVPSLPLTENPDILKTVGHHDKRPKLVIGFAAETNDVETNARAKLDRKGADMIVANDVSPETGIMGGKRNTVALISRDGVERWPEMSKDDVAEKLVAVIASKLAGG
jgi:phosphopantothenoylcysteine decarboxylase/phosphopantothenate--cysteine ligase